MKKKKIIIITIIKKLYNGTVSEKLNIAKKFRENYERLKELK